MKSLKTELDPVSSRVAAYASGLPLLPSLSSTSYRELPSLAHIDNCLTLLDSQLLGQWSDGEHEDEDMVALDSKDASDLVEIQRREGLGGSLIALCIAADVVAREGQDVEQRDTGMFNDIMRYMLLIHIIFSQEVYRVDASRAHQPHA